MSNPLIPILLGIASLTALADQGRLLEMRVEARDYRPYPEYRYRGQTWIPGEQGEDYQVRLRNLTNDRIMVVLSVDGVNAVSGETAGYRQTGYVLGPRGSTVITGWRKSMDTVARFYFSDLTDSYAARTRRPDDVGVIGAAVFQEQPHQAPPIARHKREGSFAAAPRSAQEQQLGTGHGELESSHTRETRFERASEHPFETLAIRYDSRRNLAQLGVIPHRSRGDRPSPFPREGFVPDPPRYGWNRYN